MISFGMIVCCVRGDEMEEKVDGRGTTRREFIKNVGRKSIYAAPVIATFSRIDLAAAQGTNVTLPSPASDTAHEQNPNTD